MAGLLTVSAPHSLATQCEAGISGPCLKDDGHTHAPSHLQGTLRYSRKDVIFSSIGKPLKNDLFFSSVSE